MFSEINAKLVEIQAYLRKIEKYDGQLTDYKKELAVINQSLSPLQKQFKSEQKDVQKLERISLTNLFASLAGTKDEKLSKEKQEMIAAQHKLEEMTKSKAEIELAISELNGKLRALAGTGEQYQQLLKEKEMLIKTSTAPNASQLFELSVQEGIVISSITELQEAIDAGKTVESSLRDAIHSLEKAGNWGTWDMFGGGAVSGLVKHQHIDQAESYIHRAQTDMRRFQKELVDIQETADLEVDISSMLKFADFFFDGFIADFMVQGRINRSLEQTRKHHSKVQDILQKLTVIFSDQKKELETIQTEKKIIIEQF